LIVEAGSFAANVKSLARGLAAFENDYADLQDTLGVLLKDDIGDSLKDLVKSNIEDARTDKEKKHDKMKKQANEAEKRVSAYAMNPKCEQAKLTLLENERDEAKAAFEDARKETLANLAATQDKVDRVTAEQLSRVLLAYRAFLDGASARLDKTFETLSTAGALSPQHTVLSKGVRSQSANSIDAVFGVALEDLYKRKGAPPAFFTECVRLLTEDGMNEEGVFRLSGSSSAVATARTRVDAGDDAALVLANADVNTVAALLKEWLRKLPVPLMLPSPLLSDWLSAAAKRDVGAVRAVIARLPVSHRIVLRELCTLLAAISRSPHTKMTPTNLSICITPNVLASNDAQHNGHGADVLNGADVLVFLISRVRCLDSRVYKSSVTAQADEVFNEGTSPAASTASSFMTTPAPPSAPPPTTTNADSTSSPAPQARASALDIAAPVKTAPKRMSVSTSTGEPLTPLASTQTSPPAVPSTSAGPLFTTARNYLCC
jgi:hypothetical protein